LAKVAAEAHATRVAFAVRFVADTAPVEDTAIVLKARRDIAVAEVALTEMIAMKTLMAEAEVVIAEATARLFPARREAATAPADVTETTFPARLRNPAVIDDATVTD
jgi:hypothetical protein